MSHDDAVLLPDRHAEPPTDAPARPGSGGGGSRRRRGRGPARWHGVGSTSPADRRWLERHGWRTTLDYHEEHRRDGDGVLVRAEPVWTAVAEHAERGVVRSVRARTVVAAWSMLCDEVRRPAA